ncbi:hypothetical protein DFJ77DRAFT_360707 [Powellomyces hirtus]|nr:hypothetical protein DFJ77DRAFT_360707 [Powellomyces hirtus]
MAQTNTNQEVLQFLQDLDNIVPGDNQGTTPGSAPEGSNQGDASLYSGGVDSAGTSEDVLNFLNELDSPGLPPPATNIVQPPSTSQLTTAVPSASAGLGISSQPVSVLNSSNLGPTQQQPPHLQRQSRPGTPASAFSTTTLQQQQAQPAPTTTAPLSSSTPVADSWGWSNIWTQAAKVGATATTSLTKGLESAKAMAEETAKAVSENENIKGIINKEQLGKLGTDLSRLTHSLVDTIAPPIMDRDEQPLLASVVTVYFSSPADSEVGDLRDFILATVREMWIGRVCDRVALEGIEGSKEVKGVPEAVTQAKATMEHLQHLSTTSATPQNATHAHAFLVIQPLAPQLPSPQTQYYVTITSGAGAGALSSASALSQSVADGAGEGLARKWAQHQKRRVVETVVADVCEEFGVRCQESSELKETVVATGDVSVVV